MMQLKTALTRHAPVRYLEGGSGPPLVFLHGWAGVEPEDPLLNALTRTHRVFAPYLPGYGETEDCAELRDMLDYTLFGWDLVEAFGLRDPILVGHSMGGMIAAEMAAIAPREVSRLVLVAPAGLWLEDHPIPDLFTFLPYQLPEVLFHDPKTGAGLITAGLRLDDPKFLQDYLIRNARQLGMAGKLLFPVPERGLAQRLYRIRAHTLVVWGESDRLIPAVYGPAFAKEIAGARLMSVAEAGHMITLEKPAAIVEAVASLG